jgi:hypothetical protein
MDKFLTRDFILAPHGLASLASGAAFSTVDIKTQAEVSGFIVIS